MPSFDAMRDRLPLLYRPEDDDASGDPLPLAPADVLEIACEPAPARAPALAMVSGAVVATLGAPARVRSIRLAAGRAPGTGCALELYRMDGSRLVGRPATSVAVRDGVAVLTVPFEDARFGLRLRRPGLLPMLLRSFSGALDDADAQAQQVLQSHWFGYADRALLDPWFFRGRELRGQATLRAGDAAPLDSPYVRDLARLGALVAPPPWTEPRAERETVEEYRDRVRDFVRLYREGLGTVHALRTMVEAQLPTEHALPAGRRDRGVGVEEFAPAGAVLHPAPTLGAPAEEVGPLMRWTVRSDGLTPAPPTLYVQGVEPQGDRIAATARPLVELYAAEGAHPCLGIAYDGTVAPGETLRLRPAYLSWLGREDGLRRAESLPGDTAPASPTAPGPWRLVPAPPEGPPRAAVAALRQTRDRTLWAAFEAEGGGELWRSDGRTWRAALTGLAAVHALGEDGDDLLVGTEAGLLRVALFPEEGEAFAARPVDGVGEAVDAVFRASDGRLLVGTAQGVVELAADASALPYALHAELGTGVRVHAIAEDRYGSLYFGTGRGLFRHQPRTGETHAYSGEEHTESGSEWVALSPGEGLPAEEALFLPPVLCVHRGRDSSLWLGTAAGIARYVARPVRGLVYTTLLEAFPELSAGRVSAIREDERGEVWFCTDRGLLRHDGRDWWHHHAQSWTQLGRADRHPAAPEEPRPPYRWDRAAGRWQRWSGSAWLEARDSFRTVKEKAVRDLLWTDHVAAEVGEWDGARFTRTRAADAALLRMRHKPSEERVVDGGVPAIPRVPPGASTWRYLALEGEAPLPARRPAWTIEGRLLPPPDAPAAHPGRFDLLTAAGPPPDAAPASGYDEAVFAYAPAARVWLGWEPRRPLAALVRLRERAPGENIDPAVLDRVWQGIQQVRPAGVRALLAVEETIVRGNEDASGH